MVAAKEVSKETPIKDTDGKNKKDEVGFVGLVLRKSIDQGIQIVE